MNLGLTKRQKIIVAAILITLGLLSTHLTHVFFLRYRFVLGLGLVTYLLSLWALWEGMSRLKSTVLLILPTLFTLGVASFYFLLPVRWLTRLPWAVGFGLSFYILLLSQNVFNVASLRTIPLYRAASTVSFLFTLITAFFLFNVVHAFNLSFYWNGLLTFVISFPLILQILWTLKMEEKITSQNIIYSAILGVVTAEFALALSFWPVAPTIWSLSLATVMYISLGIILEFLRERLSRRVVWEYLAVGVVVFMFSLMSTSWVG